MPQPSLYPPSESVSATGVGVAKSPSPRIASLDQFRGYTVWGMFLVNFVGSYQVINATLPLLKHHHTYCSYADTIMPHFLFAVGFAFRLTFVRRRESHGSRSAFDHAVRRNIGLLLVAFIIHHLDGQYASWSEIRELGPGGVLAAAFQRNFFQTLTHIAVTSLWIIPVIGARARWRILYAVMSGVLFHLLSEWWYYDWVMQRPGIDGGPLGFLGWTTPAILGSLAYDLMRSGKSMLVGRLLGWSALVMLVGYGLACMNRITPPNTVDAGSGYQEYLVEPPFVEPTRPVNIWTMSQRAGSISYLTFGAGFSLAVYALFVLACDVAPLQLGLFRTFGNNALAGYILHDLMNSAIKPFFPKDSPLWYVFVGVTLSMLLCYVVMRHLERHRLFLRL